MTSISMICRLTSTLSKKSFCPISHILAFWLSTTQRKIKIKEIFLALLHWCIGEHPNVNISNYGEPHVERKWRTSSTCEWVIWTRVKHPFLISAPCWIHFGSNRPHEALLCGEAEVRVQTQAKSAVEIHPVLRNSAENFTFSALTFLRCHMLSQLCWGKKNQKKEEKKKSFWYCQYWRPNRKSSFFLMVEKHLAAFFFRENAVLCCWEEQRLVFSTTVLPCFPQSILIQLQVGWTSSSYAGISALGTSPTGLVNCSQLPSSTKDTRFKS